MAGARSRPSLDPPTSGGGSPGASGPANVEPGDGGGEVLDGRYRLGRVIGAGGMGRVYEAVRLSDSAPVAIKVLNCERTSTVLERFRRESSALTGVHSEHVVKFLDIGSGADGAPFLVMELLVGEDLRGLLKRNGPLSAERAVQVLIEACRGVGAAHAQGLVHRDLKPENLFLAQTDGRDEPICKVLDFGVVKSRGDETVTVEDVVVGTVMHMAPEQITSASKDGVDQRVDVFALGTILYECLLGRPAFRGASREAILYRIVHEPQSPLDDLSSDVPRELVAVMQRALAPAPQERYVSANQLGRALESIQTSWKQRPEGNGWSVEAAPANAGTTPAREPIVHQSAVAQRSGVAASFIDGPVRFVATDGRVTTGRWGPLGIVIGHGAPNAGSAKLHRELTSELLAEFPRDAAMLVIVAKNSTPSAADRQTLSQTFKASSAKLGATALVFEANGFIAATQRAILTAMTVGAKGKLRIFGSVHDAALWLRSTCPPAAPAEAFGNRLPTVVHGFRAARNLLQHTA